MPPTEPTMEEARQRELNDALDEVAIAAALTDKQWGERYGAGARRPNLVQFDGRTIHQRMVAIIDELPAIGKTQRNEQQKFMFRGHDDVMNALNPLLAKHGVFVVPHVLERITGERTASSGKTMYEVNLHVEYTFWGAGGDSFSASGWGEGTDMGDKSTSKAMTMAFKYVVAQAFALATEETSHSDADAGSAEETTRAAGGGTQRATREQEFNPATMLLPNASKGATAVDELTDAQRRIAVDLDWREMLDVAATATLGPASERTAPQKKELMYRWSNTIAKLEELCDAHPELYNDDLGLRGGEEGDALIIEAFRFGFGYELVGPLPKVDADEAPLPEASDEQQ